MMGLAAILLSGVGWVTESWAIDPAPTAVNRALGFRRGGTFFRFNDFDGRRGGRNRFGNNNQGTTVIYPDNGYGNWNNSNYLGYPPWYRLNYYTPWMSDYENGTAWKNIPNSHAAAGFGYGLDAVGENAAAAAAATAAANAAAETPNVDFVVAVQRELRRRGFYRGVVNGVSDAPTRAAIRAFETSNNLPVTGVIGTPLLRALGFF